MKIAILGSGNGACAMAFEWARAGHDGLEKAAQLINLAHHAKRTDLAAPPTMRAWRGLGEVAWIAGAIHSNPPQVGFFGCFLAETRK